MPEYTSLQFKSGYFYGSHEVKEMVNPFAVRQRFSLPRDPYFENKILSFPLVAPYRVRWPLVVHRVQHQARGAALYKSFPWSQPNIAMNAGGAYMLLFQDVSSYASRNSVL